ncbi:TPA: right-handed parallel beta-helix repeat-containing protein, partial [Raoultella ornithinolytica]
NGAGDKNGGQLTLLSAHSGATLLIYRDPDATQLTSYLATGKFPATSHERALDKLTMLIQKFGWWWDSLALKKPNIFANYYDALNNRIRNLRDPSLAQDAATKSYVDSSDIDLQQQITSNFNRSLRVPDSYISQLPSAQDRAWKGLGFDGAGQPKLQDPAGTGLWGYVPAIGSFEQGSLLTQRFEVLLWESTDEYWRWDGAMPKIVLPGSTPDTAGGRGKGKWLDVTDATLRSNLGSSDGAKLIGGLNYVTPEMSGFVTGAGNDDDDTAAIQWALDQNAAQVVLDSTKTYNIQPGVIQYTGKVNVDAGTAKIVCDGVAVDIIDGAGSVWKGGNLLSKTTPWTVVYDEDFNIVESGTLGYGRMPYQDDTNVDPSHYYQQICCSLVFRSSTSDVLDGLTVSGVSGSYAAVVAAGFKNTKWTRNKIRGGALAGAIMVLNDCELPVTAGFGWNAGAGMSYGNPFKWARGSNHSFVNCDLFEGRQMGLCVTGSDHITISNINTYGNAESGIQTGQYSSAYPQESIICKHIIQTNCKTWGNYYDGFDHASVTSGAAGPYFEKYLIVTDCEGYNNRATGIFAQGNNLQIKGNNFHDNGTHGIRVQDSAVVDISRNQCLYNGKLAGGYQIAAVGSDMSVDDNTVLNTSQTNSHLVNISIGLQTQKQFGVKFRNTPLSTRSSPKTVIGVGVLMSSTEKTSDGSAASYSGLRTASYIPAPIAGDTRTQSVASEAGAVAAWKHPATGAWMRLFTNDLTGATNTGFSFGYNWGKNTNSPSGYWDNSGIGGTLLTFNPTSIVFDIHAAGIMSSVGGITIASTVLRPNIDNTISGGQSSFRFTQLFATNSTIGTCDADEKMEPVDPNEAEINAFYEISLLPWVWQWLEKYQVEGDNARLHSGPTVQAAIAIMDKHGLDWTRYAAFCYDEWDAWEGGIHPVTMQYIPPYEAGHRYGFRKEELILWMLRATVEKQKSIEARLSALESK